MNNDNGSQLIQRIILIVVALLVVYYYTTTLIMQHIYHEPLDNLTTYIAYCRYLIASAGDFSDWTITLSQPIRAHLAQQMGTDISTVVTTIPAMDYRDMLDQFFASATIYHLLSWYMLISIVSAIYIVVVHWRPEDQSRAQHIRGTQLTNTRELNKKLQKGYVQNNNGVRTLYADPIMIPADYETRHILIVDSTGSGKSVMLCNYIDCMIRRKAKILLYDRKGELISKFYRTAKDILFNPYDKRFGGWSIFNEFDLYAGLDRIPEELTNLAHSLFSVAADNKNKAFYNGAASIFKSGCCWLKIHQKTTNQDLYNFFMGSSSQIKAAIETLPLGLREGQAFLSGEGDVMASFLSCLIDWVKAFGAFVGRDGDLSIRDWINDDNDDRRLIISTASSKDEIYLPIITTIVDIIGHGLREKPESKDRRAFFVLDELSSLPPLKTLQMLLREGRSRGASVWLTTQTMSAVEAKYGKNNTADIMGLCNSLFVFRTSEPAQSRYFSDALGNAERLKINQSEGHSSKGLLGNSNKNENKTENRNIEAIVLPGELQELPVGCAYVKIGAYPVAKVQFAANILPDKVPYYLPVPTIKATAAEIAAAAAAATTNPNKDTDDAATQDDKTIFRF
ncbi:type IV secretion system DNA-binding domain-containing protein [Pectinatus haikarae]|uniref:Type IV secretory pathway TraG/TraD family ATPase VirD4 n=1 Tax=Pectinatus haikarae TaxID=349096 RepID=A0ABT9Y5G8_9FIRM|nr:type IV secretion system DNA-binding domain-containing protein [Pectinatus haikarae]MDQ0202873.1 type IV secretory pathway TraG/TraD family ATPase VirD4 [Pectinatus haikarae]